MAVNIDPKDLKSLAEDIALEIEAIKKIIKSLEARIKKLESI